MKQNKSWIKTAVALAASLGIVGSALADVTISDFHNFTSDALYASWLTGTINSTPTNYIVTATGYGSNWKALPTIAPLSNTNIELTVDLSGSAGASGQLGPIVTLVDSNGNEFNYAWYGQQLGHHVLTLPLSAGTRAAGSGALNIGALAGIHMQLDPSGYTSSPYTVAWDLLRLTSGTGSSSGCATIDAFDGSALNGYNGGWATATIVSTSTNLQITATGFGDAYQAVTPVVSTTSNMTLSLDVTLTASDVMGPLVILQDGSGNQLRYAFYNTTAGHHVLTAPLSSGTLVSGAGPFNFSTISFIHMQLDPEGVSGSYTVAFNDLSVTGCGGSGPTGCGPIDAFDGTALNGYNGGWASATILSTSTNLQITASGANGFGDAYQAITPVVATTSNLSLALDVTLTASDVMGPVVVIQDGGGNQMQYTFLNTPAGHHVLTAPLSSGNLVAGAGPFNFATMSFFHLQLNPEGVTGTYTMAINDLSVTGCDATSGITITSKSYNPSTRQMALTWTSAASQQYSILYSATVNGTFTALLTNIASGGATTSQTVQLPIGTTGFVRIQQQ